MKQLPSLLATGLLLLTFIKSSGDEGLKKETLDHLKQATALVRADFGKAQSTGSGFLISGAGGTGLLITNSHVVTQQHQLAPRISVVFHSGMKDQLPLPAEVIGLDPSRDLAVLRVQSNRLPRPLLVDKEGELSETMPVFISGFPFGEALAVGNRTPSITVSQGAVSSIRRDEFDRIVAVQIDGSINPGNSGGPIVDREGNLVGVAVARLTGTQIGLAIPADELREDLRGRVASLSFRKLSALEGKLRLEVKGQVFDPHQKLKKASLYMISLDRLIRKQWKPPQDGRWELLSKDMIKVDLEIENHTAQGVLDFPEAKLTSPLAVIQVAVVRDDGQEAYGPPRQVNVQTLKDEFQLPTEVEDSRTKLPGDWLAEPPTARTEFAGMTAEDAFFYQPPGRVIETKKPLAGPRQVLDKSRNLTATEIRLAASQVAPQVAWAASGEQLVLGSAAGTLHVLATKDLVEQRRLELGAPVTDLRVSAEGFVAFLQSTRHLAVVDEKTLSIKRHILLPQSGTPRLACSPGSRLAFAVFDQPETALTVIDLAAGEVLTRLPMQELLTHGAGTNKVEVGPSQVVVEGLLMSPDGASLFLLGSSRLYRFSLDGERLSAPARTPRFQPQPGLEPVFSSDARYLLVPATGGLESSAAPKLDKFGCYVFATGELGEPRSAITSPAPFQAVGMSHASRQLIGVTQDKKLLLLTPTGQTVTTVPLPMQFARAKWLAIHPDGKRMCLMLDTRLMWLEM